MKTYKIRPIGDSDIPLAYNIFSTNRALPWSIESFTQSVNSGVCLVAEIEGQLQGYILCSVIFETAEVLDISVQKNVQNLGIGSALMNAVIECFQSKKIEKLILEVDEFNAAAIGLYEKYDFRTIDIRKNYYQDSAGNCSNALVMCLSL
ncbi:ribosomal protein S18-alanine N-acetyltransferase [Agaribacter marinus]|uniref:[Ribosomal protein bS18]-alanine N-acetyltransferase n=1 Tax=Agaribacter marinus TaxID=1431249 RepID=A0AA37WJU3_9ALTE|nr:ribosomal protein S18-alanine N-acetyltransferase [Agaribacter marinus]GLR70639.1 ribosomal-protein-alanine acetyltransferase [Agaribacter marinus]